MDPFLIKPKPLQLRHAKDGVVIFGNGFQPLYEGDARDNLQALYHAESFGQPSASSHDDFRVDRPEFDSRVIDAELPSDTALAFVDGAMPSCRFAA